MPPFGFLVLLFFVFTLFVLLFLYLYKRFSSVKKELAKQAHKRNGFFNNRIFGTNSIVFYHDNKEVKVEYIPGSRYSPSYIWFSMNLEFITDKTFVVYPESFFSKIGKTFGLKDVVIGSDQFDNEFVIKSSDEYFISRVLGFNIQNKLLEFKKYRPTIKLKNGVLNVYVSTLLINERDYDLLIEIGFFLYDKIKAHGFF